MRHNLVIKKFTFVLNSLRKCAAFLTHDFDESYNYPLLKKYHVIADILGQTTKSGAPICTHNFLYRYIINKLYIDPACNISDDPNIKHNREADLLFVSNKLLTLLVLGSLPNCA